MGNEAETLEGLKKRLVDVPGSVLVMVGAGVSIATATPPGKSPPPLASWPGLLADGISFLVEAGVLAQVPGQALAEGLFPPAAERLKTQALLDVASELSGYFDDRPDMYGSWLRRSVGSLEVVNPRLVRAIDSLGTLIITTNFDSLIEDVTKSRDSFTWRQLDDFRDSFLNFSPAVLHLHGHYTEPESVILDPASYSRLLRDKGVELFRGAMGFSKLMLFVGFGDGMQDPNFRGLRRLLAEAGIGRDIPHIRLAADSELKRLQKVHKNDNIEVVSYGSSHDELAEFIESLRPPPSSATRVDDASVPKRPSLVGQTKVVKKAVNQLRDGLNTIIRGPDGSGKTAIAAHVALEPSLEKAYPDGVLWASLGPEPDLAEILVHWAKLLKIPHARIRDRERAGIPALARHVALELRRRKCLLVLDDVCAADAGSTLMLGGRDCAHLATSAVKDVALSLRWLDDPQILVIDDLTIDESVKLLARIAPKAYEQRPTEIRHLLETIDAGLATYPIVIGRALERAYETNGLDEEIRQLQNSVETSGSIGQGFLKERFAATGEPWRVRTLEAVLGELLSRVPTAEIALPPLTVFRPKSNTFPTAAAEVVSGLPKRAISELINIGAIEVDANRYSMQRQFWEYSWPGQLSQLPDAVDRAADYFCAFLYPDEPVADTGAWFDAIDADLENIRALIDELIDRDIERAITLAAGLGEYWYSRSRFVVGLKVNERVTSAAGLNPLEKLSGKKPVALSSEALRLAAKVVNDMGTCAYNQGDMDSAFVLYSAGVTRREELGDPTLSGSLNNVGLIHRDRGSTDVARSCFSRALQQNTELFKEADTPNERRRLKLWMGMNLDNLAVTEFDYLDDYDRGVDSDLAGSLLEQANAAFTAAESSFGRSMVRCDQARLMLASGAPGAAADLLLRESLVIRSTGGDERGLAITLATMAHAALLRGDLKRALDYLGASLSQAAEIGESRLASEALIAFAYLAAGARHEHVVAITTDNCRTFRAAQGLIVTRLMFDAMRLGEEPDEVELSSEPNVAMVLESARVVAIDRGIDVAEFIRTLIA